MTSRASLTSGLEVVKSAAPRTVLRGGGRVVKVYRESTILDRLKRLLGRSPARREERNLRRAAAAGLPVPAIVEAAAAGPAGEESLAMAEIEGAASLETLVLGGGLDAGRRRSLTRALAGLLRRVHDAGLDHADLHAGNVLVGPGDALWLIDLHRARFRRRLGSRARRRALIAFGRLFLLHATRAERLRFLRTYDPDGRQADPRPLEAALRRSCERFWRRRVRGRYRRSRHVVPLRIGAGAWRGLALTAFDGAKTVPVCAGEAETVLKAGGRTSTVTAARIGDRDVVIKRFHLKKALSPWLDLVRGSRARRAFESGHALRMRGLPTAEPLAWLERRDGLRRPVESILVTERLAGAPGRAGLRDLAPRERRGRLERLGRTVRRLREAGFRHRDLKLDNWLWPEDDGPPALLDLDGLTRGRAGDARLGAHLARLDRDLAAIGLSRADRLRVVHAAAGGTYGGEHGRASRRRVLEGLARRAAEARP